VVGERLVALVHEALEAVDVKLVRLDVDDVARR